MVAVQVRPYETRESFACCLDPFVLIRSHQVQLRPFEICRWLTPALCAAPFERRVGCPCRRSRFRRISKSRELQSVPIDSSDLSCPVQELLRTRCDVTPET
jgi:hypothetical protein